MIDEIELNFDPKRAEIAVMERHGHGETVFARCRLVSLYGNWLGSGTTTGVGASGQ